MDTFNDYALTVYDNGPWYSQPRGKGKRKADDVDELGDCETTKRPKTIREAWKLAYALQARLGAYEIAQPNRPYLAKLAAEVDSFQNELKRLSGSVPSLRAAPKRKASDASAPEGSKARKQRKNSLRLAATSVRLMATSVQKMSATGRYHAAAGPNAGLHNPSRRPLSDPTHYQRQRAQVSRESSQQHSAQRRTVRSLQARRSSQPGLQGWHGSRRRTGSTELQRELMLRAFPPEIIGAVGGSYSAEPEEYTPYDELVSPTQGSFPSLQYDRVLQRHNSGDTESSGLSNGGYYDDIEERDMYEPDAGTVPTFDRVQELLGFEPPEPARLEELRALELASSWSFYTPSYMPDPLPPVRKALLIAIQYHGQKWNDPTSHPMDLDGAYQDAEDVCELLVEEGYLREDIRIMTDEPTTPDEDQPTHDNLKLAFKELVHGARPGDRFFIYFAGHGKQVKDLDFDEADGQDEGIIPCDWVGAFGYSDEGVIIDDYLRDTCVEPLPKGAQLTALFDSCHAGTILDLPFRYLKNGDIVVENPTKRLTGESSPGYSGVHYRSRASSAASDTRPRDMPRRIYGSVDARVICFSACEDSQNAYANPTKTQGRVTEAFTSGVRRFRELRRQHGFKWDDQAPTIRELFEYVVDNASLKFGHHIQDPQLCSSYRMVPDEVNRKIEL